MPRKPRSEINFIDLVTSRKGKVILCGTGTVKAYIDDGFDVHIKGRVFHSTVCTASCTIISHGDKCHQCHQYRSQLRSMYSRCVWKQHKPAKTSNNRYLNTPEKERKLKTLQVRARRAEIELKRLGEKTEKYRKAWSSSSSRPSQ